MLAGIRHQNGMIWTVPNMLTFFRILAAPCVALAFVLFERPVADWVAFCLFVGAALTDFLDGWLARRWGQESEIGKMLDPIADKAMVIIALAVLMSLFELDILVVIPAAAILLREVLVSGLREYLGDVKLPVTQIAKWKTTVQMLAVGVLLAVPVIAALSPVGLALLWLAAGLTVLSGWDYFRKGLVELRKREVKG